MTNEEIDYMLIEMAERVKEKMIDKEVEWLKIQDEIVGVSFKEDFIERFKKLMKENL